MTDLPLLPSRRPAPRAAPAPKGMMLAAPVLAAVVFVVDIATPLGFNVPVLYIVPLLLTMFGRSVTATIASAATASALTIVGAALSPRGVVPIAIAVMNRATALIVIWMTAAIVLRFRRADLALDARTKDLADVSYAIDQSAIVAITDVTGRIKYANDKFCEISKYSREELLGQDHRIVNSGYHPKEFIRNLWETIANGRIWRGEIRNRAKDGSIYWVDTTIVPFLDARGKPYQYMAIRYEITARKRSEELLREQTALARLGQMAAVVAHEVKNPIAGIRGALQVIASRMSAEQPRDRAVVGDIIGRLDALDAIVEDLLLFARPRQIRAERVDLAALISSTADLLRRDPALAAVELRLSGTGSFAQADREQLQIVFQNVLMNAAQAMGGRGAIDVTIVNGAGNCRVSIADHGPGMPSEVRAKAFEAFFTTKHRGTGLGLPIANRIVEAHGGQMEIDTPASGGTVVTIVLPATR